MSSFYADPTSSNLLFVVTQSPLCPSLPDPEPFVTCPQSPGILYCGHMTTVFRETPPHQTDHLGSRVQSPGWHPPRSCTWGHMCRRVPRVTPPRPCNWCHMSTVWRVTLFQTPYLGSHICSSLCDPPRHCNWSHTSTVSRVTLSQALQLGLQVHSPHGDLFSTFHLGSHIHILQGNHPRPWTCGHTSSLQGDTLLDPETGVTCP